MFRASCREGEEETKRAQASCTHSLPLSPPPLFHKPYCISTKRRLGEVLTIDGHASSGSNILGLVDLCLSLKTLLLYDTHRVVLPVLLVPKLLSLFWPVKTRLWYPIPF